MPEAGQHEVNSTIGHLFRTESGKMVSVLTRMLGFSHYDVAEDIVQETLAKAVHLWKFKGLPENPSAWLYTAAKRRAIDFLRQQKVRDSAHGEVMKELQSEWTLTPTVHHLFLDTEIEDSQLRMIFACCHPAIPYESQLALTLKTLCGLSNAEIARAFLTNEETIAKRIYRAREKIREEKISLEVPVAQALLPRIEAVWLTLYLLFNEGYHSASPDELIREDLCVEAMRLCLLLTRNPLCNLPQTNALLSLMCLQASRQKARTTANGEAVLLKDQDRSRWSGELIARGLFYLDAACTDGLTSAYHIEAAIAAKHAEARHFDQTDWDQIYHLYGALEVYKPGPIVKLNRAIALGYARGFREGLEALYAIGGLGESVLYHTAVGDFHAAIGDITEAKQAYAIARGKSSSRPEQLLLDKKLSALQ